MSDPTSVCGGTHSRNTWGSDSTLYCRILRTNEDVFRNRARSLLQLHDGSLAKLTVNRPPFVELSFEGSAPSGGAHLNLPIHIRPMRHLTILTLKAGLPRSTTGRLCVLGNEYLPQDAQLDDLRSRVVSSYPILIPKMPSSPLREHALSPTPFASRLASPSCNSRDPNLPLPPPKPSRSYNASAHPSSRAPYFGGRLPADGADEVLLHHTAHAFPKLRHLDLSCEDFDGLVHHGPRTRVSSSPWPGTVLAHLYDMRDPYHGGQTVPVAG
ncbi:hypothetical protein C8Q77DRAFT_856571 [Trametes polyzona]|nr:hypothetical protein C8Q77DRAFT_856571 [Trametes polyzona]